MSAGSICCDKNWRERRQKKENAGGSARGGGCLEQNTSVTPARTVHHPGCSSFPDEAEWRPALQKYLHLATTASSEGRCGGIGCVKPYYPGLGRLPPHRRTILCSYCPFSLSYLQEIILHYCITMYIPSCSGSIIQADESFHLLTCPA